jgi:hypothetical protein
MPGTSGIAAVLIAALLAGCGSGADPVPPTLAVPASPFQRTVGPVFAPEPPAGPGAAIDGALLARDRRSVAISFLGGQAYERTNPCSEDYGAWAGLAGDTLELQVLRVRHPEQRPLGANMACTAEGHLYAFTVLLPAPFLGTTVRDRPAGPLWIAPPDRVVEPGPLPAGWTLTQISTPSSAELGRTWGPPPDRTGAGGDGGFMALYQAFGGPTSNRVEQPIATRPIHGLDTPIGRNGDDGFTAAWMVGGDQVWFTVVDPAIDLDGFVELANGVGIPGS